MEAIRNPKIQWTPTLSKLTEARDNGIGIHSLKLYVLAQIPEYLRYPELHLPAIKSTYHQMTIDLSKMRLTLDDLGRNPLTKTLHSRFQAAYSLVLSFANIMNSILRIFPHDDTSLFSEAQGFVEETIALAEDALQYRPLGSSAMPLVLTTAWVATQDISQRSRIEELLAGYQSDFVIMKWVEVALWLEERLNSIHISLQDPGATPSKTFD